MKTIAEARDEVAQTIYGQPDWESFRSDGLDHRVYEDAHEDVAEIFRSELSKANQQWISVHDKQPEYMQTCIIHCNIGFVTMAQFGDGINQDEFLVGDELYKATHWMPLPEPPKI
jgi:hypothetical protein